jgi:O-antigen biosynthesis protein
MVDFLQRMLTAPRHQSTAAGNGRLPGSMWRSSGGRVLFVSGEPDTPGHVYRVARYATAAQEAGFTVSVVRHDELRRVTRRFGGRLIGLQPAAPELVVIWRAAWSRQLARAIKLWRRAGARIVFDVDDYMFDPALARAEIIDGIRSQHCSEPAVAELYARINRTFVECDAGIAPTETLARAMRRWGKPAFVLPNGFDGETLAVSRRAVTARRRAEADGLIRIGYAAGSRTHQRDFAIAAPAVAALLRERSDCRLVLFKAGADGPPLLDVGEYPDFAGLEKRIEWRPLRPLAELPEELARLDINLAPLETGNPFCEAKSELKFFEAALVEVCTIASPTVPFATAIADGETGLLAAGPDDWAAALRALVDDPARRRTLGQAAYHSVLWRFGPEGRRQAALSTYARLLAEPASRAREFAHARSLAGHLRRLPRVPEAEELFRHESGGRAAVAVVVPCFNYARYVVETLESVAAQTEPSLELIVVDDCSTDDSAAVVTDWLWRHAGRFVRAVHLRNHSNAGLSLTRNAGFAAAEADLVFPLDADNLLTPDCLRLLHDRLLASGAAAAHPTLERFGAEAGLLPALPWDPDRLLHGNYIDAMALIRKSGWSHVGGYEPMPLGWEDYDLWCLFVEAGLWSAAVPEATARYRVHRRSMLHEITDLPENRRTLIAALHNRHPWLDIPAP